MAKRRVFISYHHANEQSAVDAFVKQFSEDLDVFTDRSVERAADSDDVDYLARVCRERIDGTSVTIVIVGRETGLRKFVDWEIDYTLDCKHGLVAISRIGLEDSAASLPDRLKDNLKSGTGYAKWYKYPNSASSLKTMIEEACNADTRKIDNSRARRQRNG